ncbi:cysteine proteinase [Polychaeton citri CBS 116435]|uniref:Ubiquitin carboxyl-terminal hydrolase n=1 Tax=Polychaeton citri CBS 116435 TaxID=1314669 RepID=A0A9P4QEK2_9PEZI|nr:cysteine proteinase [Polychaeton citri CBS 116435]
MSFFGKLKGNSGTSDVSKTASPAKKDPNAPQPTLLEKHIADVAGPIRHDGSDKFFGFENYGSTCYCNSIIQCLYYSAPFRDHVINFPSRDFIETLNRDTDHEASHEIRTPNGITVAGDGSTASYPNPTSPARKPIQPTSPGAVTKPEDNRDSPEYRKKLALAAGPVLEMTRDLSQKHGMDESLFTSLKDIFEAIIGSQSRVGVVSPHKFLEILRRENEMFRSAMHQDAHEFLNLLLNSVVESVEDFAKKHPEPASQKLLNGASLGQHHMQNGGLTLAKKSTHDTHWVHDLFEGLLTSETRCLTCENTSQRDEAFLDLSVDLGAHTSVTSCLRKFSEEEMLCERNKFHCDNCGGLQEAEKRMKIKRLPRVLALHLKRFKYTEDMQRLQKLFHRVVYPFHLRLFNTTEDAEDPDRLYELYAVVVHIGGGPYHGHYVSIIKTQDRGWLLFDDELVEPVSKEYVLNFFGGEPVSGAQDARQLACAYVLFYQETTMEAMIREQEVDGLQAEGRVSDVGSLAADGFPTASKNGLSHMPTAITPTVEEMEHMEALAHAQTAPQLHHQLTNVQRPPFEHMVTSPITGQAAANNKSKKELKQEEKERKANAKAEAKEREAQQKAEEKEKMLKRKEAIARRMETIKKQDDELKQAMEASKLSAAEELKTRSDSSTKEGGLARFRHGSMSLRSKPKLFGGKDKDDKLPTVSQGAEMTANGASATSSSTTMTTTAATLEEPEKKEKKNRFSLGRKRSTMM